VPAGQVTGDAAAAVQVVRDGSGQSIQYAPSLLVSRISGVKA